MALVEASRFPTELVIEVIERLKFGDGSDIVNLSLTHSRFSNVLRSYEQSLTKAFTQTELRHAHVDFPTRRQGFRWLRECDKRYDVVDDLMAMLISEHNVFPIRKHNMAMVNTGILLLYRLQSFESHTERLEFLKSLPKDPLKAMYLAVHHATLTARYHGEGLIHQRTYGRLMDGNEVVFRSDIEFCFAEASMELGPDFIHSSLLPTTAASTAAEAILLNLFHDHAMSDWVLEGVIEGAIEFQPPNTHGPLREFKPISLWTTILERIAKLTDCPVENVKGAIEEEAAPYNHGLAWLGLEGKEMLMKGKNVDPDLVE